MKNLLSLFLILFACTTVHAEPKPRQKILFLGDSITNAGHYVDVFETWMRIHKMNEAPEVIGMGLSSETISGLSEAHHPFPRPYVHNRFQKVLKDVQPTMIVACYGMNCGIYHPFSEERFTAYKTGVERFYREAKAAGVTEFVFLTPPPFAAAVHPPKGPKDGKDFGYKTPSADYDEVLVKYGEHVKAFAKAHPDVTAVDVHTPLSKFLKACYPREPIHPNQLGQEIMAEALLKALGHASNGVSILETGVSVRGEDALWQSVLNLVNQQRKKHDENWRNLIGHDRPMGNKKRASREEGLSVLKETDAAIAAILIAK